MIQPSENTEFHLLNSLTSILSSSLNIHETMDQIFQLLNLHLGLKKAILCINNPITHQLSPEITYGLNAEDADPSFTKKQVAIAKLVSKQNTPIILEKLKNDDSIRTAFPTDAHYDDCSYICLPIALEEDRIGTLQVLLPYSTDRQLERNISTLTFFTLMIAQELKLTQIIEGEKEALLSENMLLKDELREKYNINNMIGNSPLMQKVYENIRKVAYSNASVFIRGESGTGKELVAWAIHYNSKRTDGPFIKINCGAIPEALIESELFGHEEGAFTSASHQKMGKFEAASGGTIFLDEVTELPPSMQVKLLRVIQEKEITRVGGIDNINVDVRILAASNKNLEHEIETGSLRKDLYYRLNVFPINLPPLRNRHGDIILLSYYFLKKFSAENNKDIQKISSQAIDQLNRYKWPGNVRELVNTIERACILCNGDKIMAEHLPPHIQNKKESEASDHSLSLEESVNNFEKNLIETQLKKNNYNQAKTAKSLKTTARIIGYKIKKLGIDIETKED